MLCSPTAELPPIPTSPLGLGVVLPLSDLERRLGLPRFFHHLLLLCSSLPAPDRPPARRFGFPSVYEDGPSFSWLPLRGPDLSCPQCPHKILPVLSSWFSGDQAPTLQVVRRLAELYFFHRQVGESISELPGLRLTQSFSQGPRCLVRPPRSSPVYHSSITGSHLRLTGRRGPSSHPLH